MINVYEFDGKWAIAKARKAKQKPVYTGTLQQQRPPYKTVYKFWGDGLWAGLKSGATWFDTEDSAREYLENHRDTIENMPE